MGSAKARRALEPPPFPETLRYLWDWARELHGRSGLGTAGVAPLSYTTVVHWSELTGNKPTHYEVDALMELDAILCTPPERKDG